MLKPLSFFTDRARQSLGDTVLVAVPAQNAVVAERLGVSATAGILGIFHALAGLAVLALAAAKAGVERYRGRSELGNGGPLENVMVVFFADRVEFYRSGFLRKRLKAHIATLALDDLRYVRTTLATDTRLHAGATEWMVNGWYERDLRAVLRPLGVQLEELPPALPGPLPQAR